MQIPKVIIKAQNDVSKYYLYRAEQNEDLSDDIAYYKTIEPLAVINNSGKNIIFKDNNSLVQDSNIHYNSNYKNPVTINKPVVMRKLQIENQYGKGANYYLTLNIGIIDTPIILKYRAIAEYKDGSVSMLSDTAAVAILQNVANIKTTIEYYKNGWFELSTVPLNTDFDLFKQKIKINPFVDKPLGFTQSNVQFDNRYVLSDNITIISIDNPWNDKTNKWHRRCPVKLRAKCTLNDGNYVYSDQFQPNEIFVPIDKIVILKKEYDGYNDDISIDDENAERKVIVRAGGIYDVKNNYINQFNEETIINDIAVISFNNIFNKLKINSNVVMNKTYKYTFLTYSSTGECSNPYTVIKKF